MSDPLTPAARATRHALAKIARMAGSAPPGLPFLRGIERVARDAIGDPLAELDADLLAAAAMVAALADYAPEVDKAALTFDTIADGLPMAEVPEWRELASSLRDLAAGLRLARP